MNATTVAVDLAKSVFQLAVVDAQWRIVETQRLTRTQFERWFANRDVGLWPSWNHADRRTTGRVG